MVGSKGESLGGICKVSDRWSRDRDDCVLIPPRSNSTSALALNVPCLLSTNNSLVATLLYSALIVENTLI